MQQQNQVEAKMREATFQIFSWPKIEMFTNATDQKNTKRLS